MPSPPYAPEALLRDTIAAIATPPGRGGIGILRLSGPHALAIATPLLRLRTPLEPNRARFCEVIDPTAPAPTGTDPSTATKLDEAIVTYYAAPRSYTGEDIVEIAAHGSPVLLDFLLRHTLTLGARLAAPGEFTERAFLSGRLDLTQSEAVRDLIDAQTLYQARVAAAQLDGALSRRVRPIKDALIHLIALLEAGIDFAEDDTPVLAVADFIAITTPITAQLAALAHSFAHGRLVHSGFTLAIVGAPNVGKSSLFNRLVERERAIVTASPGTTRDLVTERVSLAGLPIELMDTAGLRQGQAHEPLDEAETLGIQKSREALAEADLVLLVLDAAQLLIDHDLSAQPVENLAATPAAPAEPLGLLATLANRRALVVLNKCDLLPGQPGGQSSTELPGYVQHTLAQIETKLPHFPVVVTSAQTGEGLAALREAIATALQAPAADEQSGMLTNVRQHQAVSAAAIALERATSASSNLPHEMLLLDLYTTLRELDTLTGETTSDDILNLIFSTFCIGK